MKVIDRECRRPDHRLEFSHFYLVDHAILGFPIVRLELYDIDGIEEHHEILEVDYFLIGVVSLHRGDGEQLIAVADVVAAQAAKLEQVVFAGFTHAPAVDLVSRLTLGMMSDEQAKSLKNAGLDYYNHNVDTSAEYYGEIVTTHTYADRLETLHRVRQAGINICSGGIVGMGEGQGDRAGMLETLANLEPHPESVPINLLVPIGGTPWKMPRPSIRWSWCARWRWPASPCLIPMCACRRGAGNCRKRPRRCASSPAPTRSSSAASCSPPTTAGRAKTRTCSPGWG